MSQGEWEVDGTRDDGTEYRWVYSVGGSIACAGIVDHGSVEHHRVTWWVECFAMTADGKTSSTDQIPMLRAMIEGMVQTVRAYHLGDEPADHGHMARSMQSESP